MSYSRMILLVISIIACLFAQTTCNVQYPNIDENTGCPFNVDHICTICAEDQNRLGCYCELDNGDPIITASIFTPCPSDILDPCTNNSCKNGATCVRDGLADYKCTCASGFGGKMCDDPLAKCSDPTSVCKNAECVETNDPLVPVYCQCYDGTRRDPRQNLTCPLSPCYEADSTAPVCQNGGICRIINNAYVCECAEGYAGQNCTKSLRTPLCSSQPNICGVGKCQQSLTPPYYSCNCGNYPSTFATDLNKLAKCEDSGCYAVNPCQNGGTCSNKGAGAFICQCPPRYTGSKCEKQSACFNNPCLNGGVCDAFNETVYFCTCRAYYTGQRCEIPVPNPCLSKNCGPYGECRDNNGVAVCQCGDGLHLDGSACQDPCLNKICNSGVCTKKANASYETVCSCPPNRKGDSCELPRDVCRESPRCGGGYCQPAYNALGYTCLCEGNIVKNEPCPFSKTCPIKDCGANGICVETGGISATPGGPKIPYVCLCKEGYINSGNCDPLFATGTGIDAAKTQCGPNGRPYPSRNPYNPIGCWCANGTHIEEIQSDGPLQYCL